MNNVLNVHHVSKVYRSGDRSLHVLRGIAFHVREGEVMSIVGPSGSGKSTLLGLCAGLDDPTQGRIELLGHDLGTLGQDERAKLRNRGVGFIFQNFQLIPTLTALENVMLPLELQGDRRAASVARELLGQVGLGDRNTHYPTQLSGGEQQRVSIARAFANTPKILFADEPTGNLDEETGASIEALLFQLNKEHDTALIIVTHDRGLAQQTGRVLRLKGGEVHSDSTTTSYAG